MTILILPHDADYEVTLHQRSQLIVIYILYWKNFRQFGKEKTEIAVLLIAERIRLSAVWGVTLTVFGESSLYGADCSESNSFVPYYDIIYNLIIRDTSFSR